MFWRIYYEDGSTFSSEQGSPFDAPRTGVQVIVHEDGDGLSLMSQSDFYYWEPERSDWGWSYCDQYTLVLHLQRAKRPLILFGSMVTLGQFTEIEKRALSDVGALKVVWRRGVDKANLGATSPDGVLP